MLKRTSALLVAGLALGACDTPAGGVGYFDAVAPTQQVEEPTAITQQETTEGEATELLEAAIEEAITEGEVTEPEPAPVEKAEISTDDGTLNLNISSQEQQKIERDKAAIFLAEARAQYVIIEPGTLPEIVDGVNIALYARETTNQIGEKLYRRPLIRARISAAECAKFDTPDDAQRYFLANNGPVEDPLNLDPDGDGFACNWSPEYYRLLK